MRRLLLALFLALCVSAWLGAFCGARAAVDPVKPDTTEKLPNKADEPRDCQVKLRAPVAIYLVTEDGRIIALPVLSSIRTRC